MTEYKTVWVPAKKKMDGGMGETSGVAGWFCNKCSIYYCWLYQFFRLIAKI